MVNLQKGITLIELMIVVAILLLSIFAVIPFSQAWIANNQIMKTEKMFLEAYERTKNEAIRNPQGIKQDSTQAVASLKVDNTNKIIQVVNSLDRTLWEVDVPTRTSINLTNSCLNQIKLNNNAHVMTSGCTTYTISASGGTDAQGSL